MSPKVSVIVPCYGVEKYLTRCVNTLVNQTLQDIEIILVDDGSPDNVPKMCDEWSKKDERIKVIHKENAGLGYARNSGLKVAEGEYVAFVDSDDYVDTAMYGSLYTLAKNKGLDALFCGFKKEYAPNKFQIIQECAEYTEFSDEDVKSLIPDFIASEPYSKREYKYDMSVWHAIYKRSVIAENDIQFVSERDFASEDIPFQIDFLTCAAKMAFVPNVYYNYCWNGGSLTKKISREKFDKIKALYGLLASKSSKYDEGALRSKRLFIGYMRTFVRTIVRMNMPMKEKRLLINDILQDDIWETIRVYKSSYLPCHQRIFTILFYKKNVTLTYLYAALMELVK